MQRVAVIGSGGQASPRCPGRSARSPACTCIHLDHHYWSPGLGPDPRPGVGRRPARAARRRPVGRRRELRRHARAARRASRTRSCSWTCPAGSACSARCAGSARPTAGAGLPRRRSTSSSSAGSGRSRPGPGPKCSRSSTTCATADRRRPASSRTAEVLGVPRPAPATGAPDRTGGLEKRGSGVEPSRPGRSPPSARMVAREADRTRARRRRPDRPGLPRRSPVHGLARGDRLGPTHTPRVIVGTSAGAGVGAYLRLGLGAPDLAAMLSIEPLTERRGGASSAGSVRRATGPRRSVPARWPAPPHPRLLARGDHPAVEIRPEAVLGVTFPAGRVPDRELGRALRTLTGRECLADRPALDLHGAAWTTRAASCSARRRTRDRRRHRGRRVRRDPGYFQPVEIDGALVRRRRCPLAHERRRRPTRGARPRARLVSRCRRRATRR